MKRFYLTLCFLMSVIGSAWGQETFTVEENTTIPIAGEVVQHVTDGFVTVQYASEQVTSGDIAEFAIRSTSNNEYYIATTKGAKEFEYQDGVVKGGTFFALKSTRSGQITVKLYNGKSSGVNYKINVISGGEIVQKGNTATFTAQTLGTHTMDIEADVTYYFYTNGTGSTGFGGYTFTPSASTLTIGNSEAVADYTYVYDNDGCNIGAGEQMNDMAKSGSSFKFNVTPEVSGTYSFTSFISTAFSGRYVSLYNGETLIEKKELTTYSGDAHDWTQGKDYTWSVANLVAGQTYEMRVVCEKDASAADENQYTANVYKMRIVRTPDKTGLIQIPVDMLNISANTTAGDGFDRFYRGVNLNFAGNAVVSEGKNMVTLGAATDKLAAGSITVTVPDQTDADSEYIQQVQFNVNGGIITDDNKTTLLKVYNGDTEITGGTWTASGTEKLIWDAPADVRTLSLKFVDNADDASTPAIKQVQVNVYEVKTLANSGRLGTVMPAFSKSEVSMRNSGVKYTNSLGKVKVNGSEYNNFEVLYTFETTITENDEDGRTYYSLTPVTEDPVTGSTINPATGQVTTGATAGTVKIIAYYDGLQENSTNKANYAYNPVKAEYTLNVVAPAVIEIGDEEKVAKNIHVQDYDKCSINGTWQDGQLMDSSTDGAYVTFKVKPTVDGTYTFTSEIGTVNDERTITLSCNDGSSDIFTETKDITNNGNWTNDLRTYTWTVPGLKAETEYTIKLQGNKKSDVGNNYIVNIYPMTIVRVATATTTTFNVSDFRYAGQSSSREQSLDRAIGGFSFTYTGGEAIKYNADNNFFFRGGSAGTLTIAPTDANNKITQIVIGSATDVSAVTGFTVTADGNSVTPVLANGSITIDVPAGASSVVISTNELSASVNISSYTISTTDQPSEEPYQPVFAFDHASLTVAKTGGVANALTTTPKNYPVTYSSSNTGVATVDAQTGAVTLVAAGTTTITVSSTATNYFNAANASYTLTVVDDESVAGKTWDFTTWSTTDITTVEDDDSTWEYNDNGYHKNKTGTSQGKTDFGLAVMEGLLFTTTGSDQIRIYPNTAGQTDGSIRLQSKNAKIYMPELKAGQTITLTMMTASASSARGMVFSGAGADKVQLIYGAETSKTMNVVTYRVTEDISAEELIMSASTGGLYLYSIKLGYSELYWTDGSNTVTDVAVTAAGETSYKLNSTVGVEYTITDANGNASTDVEVVDGKVKVNTFTLGNTHTITATVDGHSATLTLRMVNTASISYEQTTATGTLGFSFVEPVLTKNPEGLNVVKWKSSNPEVATVVADNGEVTFVSAGTTIITAYIEENNYYAYQEASYTLTVKEAEGVEEPWTLSLVEADGESVAVGSTGHKLTMTAAGTIKAGQVTNAIPGLTLSFGKTGGSNWNVAQENTHFGGNYVAGTDTVTLAKDSYLPTGGAYLGLEPTVNGVLSLHAAYYRLQGVVVVEKETNTVVAERRVTDDNHYDDYEFTVPLQANRTYYVYNIGNSKEGAYHLKYGMPVNAITFTPVFLDRIGHVIVKNNEYKITGAQLADDIHDYPTFSNVHAEEGGSVHYHSYQADGETENTIIYLDEDGNLVIDGEGTAILEAHVSHTNTSGDACHSVAKCTVTYTKSQLKFSGTGYTLASNLVESFTEPTLTLPAALSSSTVTYSVDNDFGIDSNTGNITSISGSGKTATVTATISPENIYFNPTATYTITSTIQQVPFEVLEEITVPVGTRAFSLISEDENGVLIDATSNVVIDLDDNLYG
ncbi:MAG: Ig-like domain-containing protein, partial [Prevotella sp.]|nr:Ig-like domain-containing protein [Prevotella sp.]